MNTLTITGSSFFQNSNIRNGIWFIGIPSFLFGAIDRSLAIFSDDYISLVKLFQLLLINFLMVSWIWLKPEEVQTANDLTEYKSYQAGTNTLWDKTHLDVAHSRMREMENYHMIHQEYLLPFSYLCQIYHLLNLKHLESVHHFSLSNLKVLGVSSFIPTSMGGNVKFMTMLKSPFSILKMWRQPVVEVDLTLHTPYTVELNIPIYAGKRMVVIFNSLPVSRNMHELIIDIYTDLDWPKPILKVILHTAALLTLCEDLPYLKKLSGKTSHFLLSQKGGSGSKTMWLYQRFVELYASRLLQTGENLSAANTKALSPEY